MPSQFAVRMKRNAVPATGKNRRARRASAVCSPIVRNCSTTSSPMHCSRPGTSNMFFVMRRARTIRTRLDRIAVMTVLEMGSPGSQKSVGAAIST